MGKDEIINNIAQQWLKIAERDLLSAKQGLKAEIVVTDIVCFHCQQSVEKFLKAYLVKHQIEFPKTHSIIALLNLCSTVDQSIKEELHLADVLTDYAVEIRYPDEWYEPNLQETKEAHEIALKVKEVILKKFERLK
ncbi:MAG: HEPN domain-containing protein [Ignavibacteria bacterium]|nr:HEPN domain-containing protein [Ignavibacteria bacterium]